jgi:hypothetical protein
MLLLLGGVLLAFLAFRRKKALERAGRGNTIACYFLESALEFLVPLCIALALYCMLALAWRAALPSLTLQSLMQLEETLGAVHAFLSDNVPGGALSAFLLFLVIYMLGLFHVLSSRMRTQAYDRLTWGHRWTKRVYTLLVLVCSFTLLGMRPGDPSQDVRLRIKLIREGYAEIVENTQRAVSSELVDPLYAKIAASLPEEYSKALTLPGKISREVILLRDSYSRAKQDYAVHSDAAAAVLKRYPLVAPGQAARATPSDVEPRVAISSPRLQAPASITYKQIERAKTALAEHQATRRPQPVVLPPGEEENKIIIAAEKVVSASARAQIFADIMRDVPIAGLFIEIFARTIDKVVQQQLEKLTQHTAAIIASPEAAGQVIDRAASDLVRRAEVTTSAATTPKVRKEEERLRQELARLQKVTASLNSQIEQAQNGGSAISLLFYHKQAGCPHCATQKRQITAFQQQHPAVKVLWRAIGTLATSEEALIAGTSGHPIMVYYKGEHRQVRVGETSAEQLHTQLLRFAEDVRIAERLGGRVDQTVHSGGVCP